MKSSSTWIWLQPHDQHTPPDQPADSHFVGVSSTVAALRAVQHGALLVFADVLVQEAVVLVAVFVAKLQHPFVGLPRVRGPTASRRPRRHPSVTLLCKHEIILCLVFWVNCHLICVFPSASVRISLMFESGSM
jgi:hypothetical protein